MPPKNQNAPLDDDDIASLADLIDDAASRTEEPLSLEGLDGFITALQCAPYPIAEADYLPVLFGQADPAALFADAAGYSRFQALLARRWKEIARALAAPIDSLTDPHALSPLIMDWEGMLDDMPRQEAAALRAEGVPPYASIWAAGFLQVVEHWEDDWALPPDSKDEAFVDELLDPLYVLMTPPEEWTDEERQTSREDYVALAIWSCYELREFWRDRGQAPRR
ncbi:MAG: YecA family protein [Thiobacillus sp.]|nr:YecA family protein [Thiobacillus sp.]